MIAMMMVDVDAGGGGGGGGGGGEQCQGCCVGPDITIYPSNQALISHNREIITPGS